MKYRIISSISKNFVSDSVNEHLRSGWELYGNPFTTSNEGTTNQVNFCQAMIKKEKEEKIQLND